jgi:hypothetical protein
MDSRDLERGTLACPSRPSVNCMIGLQTRGRRLRLVICLLLATSCSTTRASRTNAAQPASPPSIRWLSSDSALAQAAGAEPAAVIIAESGAVGDRFTRVVDADEKSCVLIMARGVDKIADLDLYAYSEDGTALAVDDRTDPKPTLLLCPPHPRHIYVTARIATGQGMIAVGVHSVPLNRARRVQATLHAVGQHDAGEQASASTASVADVERRLRDHLDSLGGRWTPVAQSALAVDSRIPSLTGMVVQAGTCVDALVLAPLTVTGLDIEALDTNGRTLGRAVNTEQDKSIVACAQEQRQFSLQLRPHEGSGTVLVLVSRGSLLAGRATEHPVELSENEPIEPLVENVHRQLRARQQKIGHRIAQATLACGEPFRIEESVEANCSRFDVFAGAPARGVEARAYSADGELVSMNDNGQYLPLLVCGHARVSLVFDAQSRGGPLWVEKSVLPAVSPDLIGSPRAAARLFQRAHELGGVLEVTELQRVRKLTLGPRQRSEQLITLQAGQCADVFASIEGQPTGIRLHGMDPDSGELSNGEEHPESAHLQLCCAPGSAECKHRVQVMTDTAASALFVSSVRR